MFKPLKPQQPGNFVALYALTFFFANFGPNAVTYILPSELFPARCTTNFLTQFVLSVVNL